MSEFSTLNDFSRLTRRFHEKFVSLRKKVHRVLDNDPATRLDDESYEVYVNSILIDCRAIFIENKRYKKNCTIQNFYKATDHPEFADSIDEFFDRSIGNGPLLREIIKNWVDRNLVHFDFIDGAEEQESLNGILSIVDRTTIDNIFIDIMLIAQQYNEYRSYLREQSHAVVEALTRDPDTSEGSSA